MSDYDHTLDLVSGQVRPDGIDLTCLSLPILEVFHRYIAYREWDISEMSMAKYVSLVAQGDKTLIALPVFPSRVFRHSCIWVRADGPTHPSQLVGGAIGVPEWAQTAGVYVRGILMDEYGFALDSVKWYQAGVYDAGRREKVTLQLPSGVSVESVPDRTLEQLLLEGTIDAIISSEPPSEFLKGSGKIRKLFADPMSLEQDYWRRTGVYPIMHTVCVNTEVLDRHPWVAMNLLKAFEEAKDRSVARLRTLRQSAIPLPWANYHADAAAELFGTEDYWPYGASPNATTLNTFLRYCHEQGVASRLVSIDELFPVEVGTRVKQ